MCTQCLLYKIGQLFGSANGWSFSVLAIVASRNTCLTVMEDLASEKWLFDSHLVPSSAPNRNVFVVVYPVAPLLDMSTYEGKWCTCRMDAKATECHPHPLNMINDIYLLQSTTFLTDLDLVKKIVTTKQMTSSVSCCYYCMGGRHTLNLSRECTI